MNLSFTLLALPAILLSLYICQANPARAGSLMDDFIASLQQDADAGKADAQFSLGELLYEGEGVPQDYAKAFFWFKQAAAQGHAEAQHSIGEMYAEGRGLPQTPAKAKEWWELAAAQGHAEAQCDLGRLFEEGRGVTQDRKTAREWYAKSCEGDFQRACNRLSQMDEAGQ